MEKRDYLEVLKTKHRQMDEEIEVLAAENAPDDILQRRKIAKLKLKDEIASLEHELSGS